MSAPITGNKRRILPSTPKIKDSIAQSPKTPRSSRTLKDTTRKAPTSLKSSNKENKRSSIPCRVKNINGTPVSEKLRLHNETPCKDKSNVRTPQKHPDTPKKEISDHHAENGEDSFSTVLLEKMMTFDHRASLLLDADCSFHEPLSGDSSIKVAVRVRPFSEREVKSSQTALNSLVSMHGNMTKLKNVGSGKDHEFVYDHSFWSVDADNDNSPFATQEDVYTALAKPLLQYSLEGYNTCLFAYGQTGSGKSYTIMGYDNNLEAGIVPRFSKDLFLEMEYLGKHQNVQYSAEISFYEIYNEKIFDLLCINESKQHRLCVREHPDYGPYVQGLSTHIVGTHRDIQDWLEVGNKNRATASTGMNDKSSRSHSVFTIFLTQVSTEEFEGTETQLQKTSKINLIDLAGSERAKKVLDDNVIKDTQAMETRLKEGGCINKSLHTLGKVISILSEMQLKPKKKTPYIPYRDSVLTWLLKESLGGNAKTTMIATVSPSHLHYSETLSTLRYAQQARSIVNKAKVNEDPKSRLIREMLAEIQRLKYSQEKTGDTGHALEKEVKQLRQKLHETQTTLASSTKSWQEKLTLSEKKQKEAASHLRRSGVAFTKLEKHLPSLVNLNEDPQLAEVLLYILQEGVTNVGRCETVNDNDIQLKSDLITDNHCIFTYSNETVILSPVGDSPTYVNGNLLTKEVTLHHGDRLVIGGDHFFRLNHPKEASKIKEEKTENEKNIKDFEFAKQELVQKQNERLEEELEEARLRAEEEAMEQIKTAQLKAEHEINTQRSYFEQQLGDLQKKLDDSAGKQKQAEEQQQNAQHTITHLKQQKKVLEDEILANRKKLQMEALAAQQIFEETTAKQSKLISTLEKEKMKMQEDLNKIKEAKVQRDKMRTSIHMTVNKPEAEDNSKQRDLLKISLMLREANKISERMKQPYSFSRDDLCVDGKVEIRILIVNNFAGKSTVLPLESFEEELSRMRDLSQNEIILKEENFKWTKYSPNHRKTRVSLSNTNNSFFQSFNQSFEEMKRRTFENSRLADESCSRLQLSDGSHLFTPAESTRLSSVQQNQTRMSTYTSELSVTKTTFFETILEVDTQNQASSSIIASLINLIISVYKDWKRVLSQDHSPTYLSEMDFTHIPDIDGPIVRLACNLKCLKDQASILCAVHEAVGLEDLKKISNEFREDITRTCLFVKKYILKGEESSVKCKEEFKQLIFSLIELTGALSLSAVDHIGEDENSSYIAETDEEDLCLHFLKQQNRFLSTMMDEALSTVLRGIDEMKQLQLSRTHEMSEDLVDGVMNILTSTTTLIQRCKDLMMVYADINTSENMVYHSKECFILRKFLTSVVDYNESVINLVGQSRQIASNCDALEGFTDVPVELADTTKCICAAGRELYQFLSSDKNLDSDTLAMLRSCMDKFEFAGKTVRVGVAIVIQEIEKDLGILEEHSVLSFVQSEISFQRNKSMCPLNRTSLDLSSINPQVQEKFKGRRSSIRPDMFISRYMDTTSESGYNE